MSELPTRRGGAMVLAVTRKSLDEADDDVAYWLTRSPTERIAAVESLRRMAFGIDDGAGPRLQRVCRVVRRPSSNVTT
jgi:hypothetical protein